MIGARKRETQAAERFATAPQTRGIVSAGQSAPPPAEIDSGFRLVVLRDPI